MRRIVFLGAALLAAAMAWVLFAPEHDGSADSASEGDFSSLDSNAAAGRASSEPRLHLATETSVVRVASEPLPNAVDLSACDRENDVFGCVVDALDAPIGGASIEVRRSTGEGDALETRTAADGSFRVTFRGGGMVSIRASKPGFATMVLPQHPIGEKMRIILGEPGRLEFMVQVVSGRDRSEGLNMQRGIRQRVILQRVMPFAATLTETPLANVSVRLWRSQDEVDAIDQDRERTSEVRNSRASQRAKSDRGERGFDQHIGATTAHGRCGFDDLAAGRLRFTFDHADRGAAPRSYFVDIVAGKTSVVVVTLVDAQAILGTVIDKATMRPIPNALVGPENAIDRGVRSDADGRYSFPAWIGSGTRIDVTHGDGTTTEDSTDSSNLIAVADGYRLSSVTISTASGGAVDFALEPCDTLRGRILDVERRAIVGAVITARAERRVDENGASEFEQSPPDVACRSSADGSFRLTGLATERDYELIVLADGHGGSHFQLNVGSGRARITDLGDVILPRARAVAGSLLDSDGRPVADAKIELLGALADQGRLPGAFAEISTELGGFRTARTDDLGRFRFAGLAPGDYELEHVSIGHLRVEKPVRVLPGEDLENVELRLASRLDLAVRVTYDTGLPAQGALVRVSDSAVRRLPHGIDLSLIQAFERKTQDDSIWKRPKKIRSTDAVAVSDATGLAVLKGLSNRELTVDVVAPLDADGEAVSSTAFAGESEFRVVLYTARIEGTVVDATGAPLPGLKLTVPGTPHRIIPLDSSGRFAAFVTAGQSFDLEVTGNRMIPAATHPSGKATAMPVAGELRGLKAPASGLVVVARDEAAGASRGSESIATLVRDPSGRAVARAVVVLKQVGEPAVTREVLTDPAGRARFEELASGDYVLFARRPQAILQDLVELVGFRESERPQPPKPVEPPPLLASTPVETTAGGPEVTLTLRESVELVARVVDSNDRPITKMTKVTLRTKDGSLLSNEETAHVSWLDASGRFRAFVEPSAAIELSAVWHPSDGAARHGRLETTAPRSGEIVIRLDP